MPTPTEILNEITGRGQFGIINPGTTRTIITANATNVIKAGPGKVSHVVIWGVGSSWQLDLYDDADSNDSKVWEWVSADGRGVFGIQLPMQNGIRVVTSGTTPGGITVVTV